MLLDQRREVTGQAKKSESTGAAVMVAALALLTFALGVYRLGEPSLGFDEGFSHFVAQMGLHDELRYLVAWDAHPPLHYFLLHYWIMLAGAGEFALRFTSVVPSTLIVALIYQAGKALSGRRVALLAATVTAPSPFLVFYARQARMYSLAAMLTLLTICLVLRTLRQRRQGSRWQWLGLLIALLLSLYTLYYTAFVLLFAVVLVVVSAALERHRGRKPSRLLLPYAALASAAALLYLPWIPSLLAQGKQTAPGAWRTFVAAPMMLAETWTVLSQGHTGDPSQEPWRWVLVALFALLAAVGAWPLIRQWACRLEWTRGAASFVVAVSYLAIPIVAIQAASHWRPIYNERYMIVVLPAFSLLIALGLLVLHNTSRWLLYLGLLLVLGGQISSLSNLYFDRKYAWDDFRGAVGYVKDNVWPGDVVIVSAGTGYPIFAYYFDRAMSWRGPLQDYPRTESNEGDPAVLQIGTVSPVPGLRLSTPEDFPETPAEVESHLAMVSGTARRVWYFRVLESITDRNEVVHTWLDQHLFELDHRWFQGPSYLQVYLYTTRRPPSYNLPITANQGTTAFSNGAAIVGYELTPKQPTPGTKAVLTVYWKADNPIAHDFQVFAHLVDQTGQKWAQYDGPPLMGRYPTTRWQVGEIVRDEYAVKVPEQLPVGVYHFTVGMYQLGDSHSVPIRDDPKRDAAALGEIVVHPASAPAEDTDHPALATFGSVIALQGYRLNSEEIAPGGQLKLTLNWKALDTPLGNYKVFVHVIDAKDGIISQRDSEPLDGRFPTRFWRKGDRVEDSYSLSIPAVAAPGTYQLAVGLYDPASGKRLMLSGNNVDQALLQSLVITTSRIDGR